jgi:hypothetical protein
MSRAAVFVALALASACAVRKPAETYRLVKQNNVAVLIPPGVAAPDIARRTFQAPIPAGPAKCALAGDILLQRRGKDLRITIAREALVHQAAGWLTAWASDAEAKGCIAPGSASDLAARIAEALPLDPAIAWRLLNVNDVRAGYVDLAAGNRLQVDSPVFREGTPADAPALDSAVTAGGTGAVINVEVRASPNLLGYERAWYAVRRVPGHLSLQIEPLSAERHIDGRTEPRSAPGTNYFRFDRDAAYYRLLYRADRTIVVVGASSRADLERKTREMSADTAVCQSLAGHSCAVVPANVGVNPEILIMVNGQERALPIGSTVTAAIRGGGARLEEVLPRLTLQRAYAGRLVRVEFDRAANDILALRLSGGEVLTW